METANNRKPEIPRAIRLAARIISLQSALAIIATIGIGAWIVTTKVEPVTEALIAIGFGVSIGALLFLSAFRVKRLSSKARLSAVMLQTLILVAAAWYAIRNPFDPFEIPTLLVSFGTPVAVIWLLSTSEVRSQFLISDRRGPNKRHH